MAGFLSVRDAAQSGQQAVHRCGLVDDAVGLRGTGGERQRGAGVRRVDDHGGRVGAALDAPAVREAVVAGEVVVEDQHVGAQAVEFAREFGSVGATAATVRSGSEIDEAAAGRPARRGGHPGGQHEAWVRVCGTDGVTGDGVMTFRSPPCAVQVGAHPDYGWTSPRRIA